MLRPRTLDIIVTKITPKTVTYELAATKQTEEWRVPPESSFDISVLEVGKRYLVKSKVIMSLQWDQKAQNKIPKERYDWDQVWSREAKARLGCLTSKQSKAAKKLEGMQIVGEGDLFKF